MCGLVAAFACSSRPLPPGAVADAVRAVAHRGPDGHGMRCGDRRGAFAEESADGARWALGHRRLAIVGLGPEGDQPMVRDGAWIVFNGEIYNWRELRTELEALGERFHTRTDTEVMLAAWGRWGASFVARLRGMFAFVIVDPARGTAIAARDRLGIKPLYLWQDADQAVFASEIKQFAAWPGFSARADRQAVADFLLDALVDHDPDTTMFDGVRPLRPGCLVEWRLAAAPDAGAQEPYWHPPETRWDLGWEDAVAETRERFVDAVRMHLRSDVPVGSCLSGGLDSSAVVGVSAADLGQRLLCFSSCSRDPRYDEQRYIDAVARDHRLEVEKVFLDQDELERVLEDLVYHQDLPFTSGSMACQWIVMRRARASGVPVLLDGQGGDELLGGYRKYAVFYLRWLLARRQPVRATRHLFGALVRGDGRLLRFDAAWQRYLPAWMRRTKGAAAPVLGADYAKRARSAWGEAMRGVRDLREHRLADLRRWSLPALLRYEDRNSMAHSIEARVPFLDHPLAEHFVSLPPQHLFRGGRSKRLLVAALGHALPEEVRRRRTKMGFESALREWMRAGLGARLLRELGSCPFLSEVVDGSWLASDAPRTLPATDAGLALVFRLHVLSRWARRFAVEP
ncbi:MAG: asparagine synthase (glutamine-hydrolyzing) [Phycisphaerales bacterium]|nr:asparagine synthase (glutamine-hydrolyzing) [Phycisphaerales bacterium]